MQKVGDRSLVTADIVRPVTENKLCRNWTADRRMQSNANTAIPLPIKPMPALTLAKLAAVCVIQTQDMLLTIKN